MNVSPLFKKPGNSTPRVYKGIRKAKRFSFAMAGIEFAVGTISAKHKDLLNTGVSGILSCAFLKYGKDFHDMQKILKPYYQQVVERAKKIKAAKK